MIASELEMPFFIVPRESSIFCAAGMLMTDLKHDFVRSFVARWDELDYSRLASAVEEVVDEGKRVLLSEGVSRGDMGFTLFMDMRYLKQYHEVGIPVPPAALGLESIGENEFPLPEGGLGRELDAGAILARFHEAHDHLFGYSLEEEGTPVELINLRLRAVGRTEKPSFLRKETLEGHRDGSLKGKRKAFVPEEGSFEEVPVYDALELGYGAFLEGPALLEQPNTTIFVSGRFRVVVDELGSYVVFARDREDALPGSLRELLAKAG